MREIAMRQHLFTLLASGLAITIVGCATPPETTTPNLDSHFGQAVNLAKAQQTLNPQASLNTDPVSGMNGKEGNIVIEGYFESLREAPSRPGDFINSGGGSSGN